MQRILASHINAPPPKITVSPLGDVRVRSTEAVPKLHKKAFGIEYGPQMEPVGRLRVVDGEFKPRTNAKILRSANESDLRIPVRAGLYLSSESAYISSNCDLASFK